VAAARQHSPCSQAVPRLPVCALLGQVKLLRVVPGAQPTTRLASFLPAPCILHLGCLLTAVAAASNAASCCVVVQPGSSRTLQLQCRRQPRRQVRRGSEHNSGAAQQGQLSLLSNLCHYVSLQLDLQACHQPALSPALHGRQPGAAPTGRGHCGAGRPAGRRVLPINPPWRRRPSLGSVAAAAPAPAAPGGRAGGLCAVRRLVTRR